MDLEREEGEMCEEKERVMESDESEERGRGNDPTYIQTAPSPSFITCKKARSVLSALNHRVYEIAYKTASCWLE